MERPELAKSEISSSAGTTTSTSAGEAEETAAALKRKRAHQQDSESVGGQISPIATGASSSSSMIGTVGHEDAGGDGVPGQVPRKMKVDASPSASSSSPCTTHGAHSKIDLDSPLPEWDEVCKGTLPNGLKYYIVHNEHPPANFEAHLQIHTGSLAEEEHQQGIAHFVEHVVFQGTEVYPNAEAMRNLFATWGMSFGADTNAYTDFRNTVYTFHAPTFIGDKEKKPEQQESSSAEASSSSGTSSGTAEASGSAMGSGSEPTLRKVLFALHQLAFKALMLQDHIDKERGAVLSEAQISNTIDYRVEFQEYQQLHANNMLSRRFPIGLVSQIQKFGRDDLLAFYRKWYRPDNMSIYVVGDINVEEARRYVEEIFGQEKGEGELPPPVQAVPSFEAPPADRQMVLFQHDLLHQFSFSISHLFPVLPRLTLADLKTETIWCLIGLALESRLYALQQSMASPLFSGIYWEAFDSPRDACCFSLLKIASRPSTWKEAIKCGIAEIVRMAKFGLTSHELERNMAALLKNVHQQAEQTRTSIDILEDIMDDIEAGRVVLSPKDDQRLTAKIAGAIDLKDINSSAKFIFRQLCAYAEGCNPEAENKEDAQPMEEEDNAEDDQASDDEDEEEEPEPDPTCAALLGSSALHVFITCPNTFTEADKSKKNDELSSSGSSLRDSTDSSATHSKRRKGIHQHLLLLGSAGVPNEAPQGEAALGTVFDTLIPGSQPQGEGDSGLGSGLSHLSIGELVVRHTVKLEQEEIRRTIGEALKDITAPKDLIVPEDLITQTEIEDKVRQLQPKWVPVHPKVQGDGPPREESVIWLQREILEKRKQTKESEATKQSQASGEATTAVTVEDVDEEDDDDDDEQEERATKRREENANDDETVEEIEAKLALLREAEEREAKGERRLRVVSTKTRMALLRLSNGIRVMYRPAPFRKRQCVIRVLSYGGQGYEGSQEMWGVGSMALSALLDSGVGKHLGEVVAEWRVRWGITWEANENPEAIDLQLEFSLSDNGLRKALQLLHLLLAEPRWDERAFMRVREQTALDTEGQFKDLDAVTSDHLTRIMFNAPDYRFLVPTPDAIRSSTPEAAKDFLKSHLFDARNVQIAIVGDFLPLELEDELLRYVGTIPRVAAWPPSPPPLDDAASSSSPSVSSSSPSSSAQTAQTDLTEPNRALLLLSNGPMPTDVSTQPRMQWVHINDDEPRCTVQLAFPMFTRWGRRGPALETMYQREIEQLKERLAAAEAAGNESEALACRRLLSRDALDAALGECKGRSREVFKARAINLVQDMLNKRMFAIIREQLSLLYNVNCAVWPSEFYETGTFNVTLSAFPQSIAQTVEETIHILQQFRAGHFTEEEFKEAKVPFLEWVRSRLASSNSYWMGLIEYQQQPEEIHESVRYDMTLAESVPQMMEIFKLEHIFPLIPDLFCGMRATCLSVGTTGNCMPADFPEQMQRIKKCLDMCHEGKWDYVSAAPSTSSAPGIVMEVEREQ